MPRKHRLRELFDYDKETGLLIRKSRANSVHPAGVPVGHLMSNGYRVIKVDGKNVTSRRCVWIYHNGDINMPLKIGSKDGTRDNDRIENLFILKQWPDYMWWKK